MGIQYDLVGQTFNRLTVLEFAYIENEKVYWKCQCICGTNRYVCTASLRGGHSKSCGCQRRDSVQNKFRKSFGEAAFNRYMRQYKVSANKRGYIFDLSEDQFKNITSSPCYYCEKVPERKIERTDMFGSYICNGVDRVDNSVGYTVENCVPCCYKCNNDKKSVTIDMARKIIEFIDRNK